MPAKPGRRNYLRAILLLIAVVAIVVRLAAPEPSETVVNKMWVEESQPTMGSTCRLHFVNPFPPESKQGVSALVLAQRKFLAEMEELISTWKADSQLSKFNQQETTDWYPVDIRTVEMIELAAKLWAVDKRFDITIAPLSELWGFGPNRSTPLEPDPATIDDCLQHVGMDKLEFKFDPPALRKVDPLVRVDLSALAAGYVADKLVQRLIAEGVVDFYVDVAGEIVVGGHNRRGDNWRVGVAEPRTGSTAVTTTLELTDCAVATSGNYRNFIEVDGQRYGHILDPTTGRPAETDVLSATVINDSCAQADAIATLLMTMPAAQGLELANAHDWQVLWLVNDLDGKIIEKRSNRFPGN